MTNFNSGDIFKIPHDREFSEDFFVVTRVRPLMGTVVLDAICEGAEDIQISININDVVKVDPL
jgi:hypothetical protein